MNRKPHLIAFEVLFVERWLNTILKIKMHNDYDILRTDDLTRHHPGCLHMSDIINHHVFFAAFRDLPELRAAPVTPERTERLVFRVPLDHPERADRAEHEDSEVRAPYTLSRSSQSHP